MWSVLVISLALLGPALGQRLVDTQYGQVRSHVVNLDNGIEQTSVDVWYGIPFAADTSGDNRFRNPVAPTPWVLPLEADTIPPGCNSDENCLKLNVYAPTDTSVTYPVMVWIYGGGYQSGSNFGYPGHFLASRGVIVVCLNYRLAQLGFQYTGNAAAPGNAGMFDQRMGMQWVVDNIANFGGQPDKITLFGESAGASSVSLHMLSPGSNTLFQQAIIESGAEMVLWGINPPDANPEQFTYNMAADVGCDNINDELMMECMRGLPMQTILNGQIGGCTPGYICLGMAPVVDGDFLPDHPGQLRLDGNVMPGPIISGINSEDGSIFTYVIAPIIGTEPCCNRTYFEHCLRNNLVNFFSGRFNFESENDIFLATNYNYCPWPNVFDLDKNADGLVDLVTDASFGAAWDKQLRDQSVLADSFGYVYDYMSNRSNSEDWMGTPHAAELDFVWGFPLLWANPEVQDDCGISPSIPTTQDVEFSMFVIELWTNFAKFGDPTPTPVQNPINGGTYTWPKFNEGTLDILYMGETSIHSENNYRVKDYAFWTYFQMSMTGDQSGVAQYWDVYGMNPNLVSDSWNYHMERVFNH